MSAGKRRVNGFHLIRKCQQVCSYKATGFLARLTNVPCTIHLIQEHGGKHGTK
jgi:hypothetical protein